MTIQQPLEKGIKFRLTPIDNGTVLDHLPVGTAPRIVALLGLDMTSGTVTMAINTESKNATLRKDLLFIENRELSQSDLEKIGLVAHGATWNTIRHKQVTQKVIIPLPKHVQNVIKCPNPVCITNAESMNTRFRISEKPFEATCFYCERSLSKEDLLKNLK